MHKVIFEHRKHSRFSEIVTLRVNKYFTENEISRKGNLIYLLKVISFLLLTIATYGTIVTSDVRGWSLPFLFVVFGLCNTMLVFSVAHDASHHAVSENKTINRLLEYVWDTAGISSYFWKLKHNLSHHGFTNIPGKDADIDQSKLILLNPAASRKWFHRYQHLYAPFLYALLSLNIIYIKDFKLLFTHQFGNKSIRRHPSKEIFILFAGKLFFISYMIIIPKIVLQISWLEIISYHLLMNFVIGLFIAFVLVPVHVTGASTYRLPDNNGLIHSEWNQHQIESTIDFAAGNYFINWVTGGLNTHVAHHLFPSINHIHYYQLTKIIEQTAIEMNIPYRNYSLFKIFGEHLHFLKFLGSIEKTDPEIKHPHLL